MECLRRCMFLSLVILVLFATTAWSHNHQRRQQQHLIVTSAFIKSKHGHSNNNRHNNIITASTTDAGFSRCLQQNNGELACTKQLYAPWISSISTVLKIRAGSSLYGDNDDDDGYYQRNGDGYGDRRDDEQYYSSSPSYDNSVSESGNRRDLYYEEDYYGRDARSSGGGKRDENGYYDDEGRYQRGGYDDYDGKGSSSRRGGSKTKLPAVFTSSNRKLGIIFLSSGAAFTVLGITLFFNKALMRLGNLLFVAGIPLLIGPGRTVGYFLQPQKARATGCLGCGIFLVLVGHPVIGILLEIFGLMNLFGNMFPLVRMMAQNLPVVGGLFGGGSSSNNGGGRGGKRRESRYDDEYYEDERYEREHR
ncbi:hypothetical protein ACHAXH_005362 [Discostella pseudostelligera]